jgi:carbon-monoxide dehydrogenase medium subunit
MRHFEYFEPHTLDEAVALLEQHNSKANILAGGTDLLVEIKEHLRSPDYVINIKKIPGMDHLIYDPQAGLRFGALVTTREIETHPLVKTHYPDLIEAVEQLGSIQVRNRATVAGNICRASPSADTLPPLIANGASVRLFGHRGERTVSLETFFTGPGKTVCEPNEILVEISLPAPVPNSGRMYIKHGRRKAMELATVGVSVVLDMDGEICQRAVIVLGAVAPTPIRTPKAEAVLADQRLTDTVIAQAAETAMNEARPISDVRSSAAYRREMVRVLTARAIRGAVHRSRA